ncbi:hypothetical protein [Deinococcus kurensis]|uniref:hypothetical protein n=1 Tax=Deinococcus kurensis TaxID=2662757 RepID=UPI0012D2BE17|nr:hypothetical protein [Deinococcus kurensis]
MKLNVKLLLPPEPSLTAEFSVEGRFSWAVLDAGGAVVQEGEQRNLITDNGLDYLMVGGMQHAHMYVCVGVGNRPPAFTDTRLDSEVYRYGNLETTSNSESGGGFIGPGEYRSFRRWLFPLGSVEANLAEVGFSHMGGFNSGVNIRQLFRDAQGQPQVVSVARDQQLRIRHELFYRFPRTLTAMEWPIEGLGTQRPDGTWEPLKGRGGFLSLQDGVDSWTPQYQYSSGEKQPQAGGDLLLGMLSTAPQPAAASYAMPYISGYAGGAHTVGTFTPEPYAPGSFERVKTVEIGPDAYNRDFNFIGYGLRDSYYSDAQPHWGFFFDQPLKATKLDTHRLRLSIKWRLAREAT